MKQITCHCCRRTLTYDPLAVLISKGVSWACPWCSAIVNVAKDQLQRPGLSQASKDFWGLVGGVAFFIGVAVLADRLTS